MSTMTDDETYNGWKNRETWAFNLHWSNDEGLYRETLEYATGLVRDVDDGEAEVSDFEIGENVVAFWRDYIDSYGDGYEGGMPEALRMFDREVGSWDRIDHAEIGASVRESLGGDE